MDLTYTHGQMPAQVLAQTVQTVFLTQEPKQLTWLLLQAEALRAPAVQSTYSEETTTTTNSAITATFTGTTGRESGRK